MNDSIIKHTGVAKRHKSDAYYCPYCGSFREKIIQNDEEWFICHEGCENADVDARIAIGKILGV